MATITDKLAAALHNVLRAKPGDDQHNAINRALGTLAEYDAQTKCHDSDDSDTPGDAA